MPFNNFEKETTISANEVNENFEHVGSGDWFPQGGNNLDPTNGVYDLGSQNYIWNNIYTNNIDFDGEMNDMFCLIAETTLSASSSSIEFLGLNSDEDEIYMIIGKIIIPGTSGIYFYINNDSSASYGYERFEAANSTVTSSRNTANTSLMGGYSGGTTGNSNVYLNTFLFAKDNYEKLILSKIMNAASGTYIESMYCYGEVYSSNNTVSSIKFISDIAMVTNTNIQIWAKR